MSTEPTPEAHPLRIEGTWLVQDVGRHTCGTDEGGHYGAHEPGCGLEPIVDLSTLPGWEALAQTTPQDAQNGTVCGPKEVPGGDRTPASSLGDPTAGDILNLVHTVQTRGGVGDVAGVRIERVEGGTTVTGRRMERAHATVGRALVLAAEWAEAARNACDGEDHGGTCADCAGRGYAAELLAALDGTEAPRLATGGPVDPSTPLVGADGIECFVPGVHVHRWQDQTTHADRKRQFVCTVEGCGQTREEER